ncbi:hypothetical protein BRDID11004_24030 [Bradyrhizobium diazoefficiens]
MPGELQQAPAEQKADRQATDIAEKHLGDGTIERRKAERGAAQGGGEQGGRPGQVAEPSQQQQRRGDRHHFHDRHQVEPVHEIDEVHEPDSGEQEEAALQRERQRRDDARRFGRGEHDGSDGGGLQQEPNQHRQRDDVVGKSHQGDQDRRSDQ